jgi:hypothetical protein
MPDIHYLHLIIKRFSYETSRIRVMLEALLKGSGHSCIQNVRENALLLSTGYTRLISTFHPFVFGFPLKPRFHGSIKKKVRIKLSPTHAQAIYEEPFSCSQPKAASKLVVNPTSRRFDGNERKASSS